MDENEIKELQIKLQAEIDTYKADIEKLKSDMASKDKQIGELQSYICKNLSKPVANPKPTPETDFISLYKETLKQLESGKNGVH